MYMISLSFSKWCSVAGREKQAIPFSEGNAIPENSKSTSAHTFFFSKLQLVILSMYNYFLWSTFPNFSIKYKYWIVSTITILWNDQMCWSSLQASICNFALGPIRLCATWLSIILSRPFCPLFLLTSFTHPSFPKSLPMSLHMPNPIVFVVLCCIWEKV